MAIQQDKNEAEWMVQPARKKKKRWGVLLIILLLLVLVGLGAGILSYLLRNVEKSRLARDEDALGGMLKGKSAEEISELLQGVVEEGMVNVSISARPVFEQNGKKGLIAIENMETNRYSFQVEVILEDEKYGSVYKSGLIDPGYYIEYIELQQKLPEGNYSAMAVFTTYSLEEADEPIAQANVAIELQVFDGVYYQ